MTYRVKLKDRTHAINTFHFNNIPTKSIKITSEVKITRKKTHEMQREK